MQTHSYTDFKACVPAFPSPCARWHSASFHLMQYWARILMSLRPAMIYEIPKPWLRVEEENIASMSSLGSAQRNES